MREIKFRGRVKMPDRALRDIDMEGIEWVYGNLIMNGSTPYIVGNVVEAADEYLVHEFWLPVYLKSVGQYTDLKDKNGKEVYDGDSFKAKHRSGNEYKGYIQKGLSFEFVIKSYSEDFIDGEGIRKTDFTFDINSFVQYFPVDDFEVIGNIYENPELLEESK